MSFVFVFFCNNFACEIILGSLSNDGNEDEDDAKSKMNLYFTSEIRACLDLFCSPMAPKSCLN